VEQHKIKLYLDTGNIERSSPMQKQQIPNPEDLGKEPIDVKRDLCYVKPGGKNKDCQDCIAYFTRYKATQFAKLVNFLNILIRLEREKIQAEASENTAKVNEINKEISDITSEINKITK
jgi:hypothetical protein